MLPLESFVRASLILWAKSGKAPGLLYSNINKYSANFAPASRPRRLANGLSFECDLRDHVQQQIYFFGAYEPLELFLFLSLLETGGTVIDAGANIGFYSLMMSQAVGEAGSVHSFEPVPANFTQLKKHVELNQKKNVYLNSVGLWNKEETLEMGIGSEHEFNCGGFTASGAPHLVNTVKAQGMRLDEYFRRQGLQRLDAIKMDIEGAELFALQGALGLLERFKPILCLEVCKKTCEAFEYSPALLWEILKPLGYKIYQVGPVFEASGWIPDFSAIEQRNVLLVTDRHVAQLEKKWNDKTIKRSFLNYR